MDAKKLPDKILSAVLYILPVVFLIITYVFMTMTAEDVFQAGKGDTMLGSAIAAFNYNARISDMYAWAVINHFDYQFCFGIDTVFRLIDVAMGWGMMYVITAIIISGRPRLTLRDAVMFAGVFLFIFLNDNYDSLYIAFSNIHNYLIIGLFTLVFLLPFALKLSGTKLPEGPLFRVWMLISGFLFGFSCNVTPAAFLVTLLVICVFAVIKEKRIRVADVLKSWEFMGFLGVIMACVVMYGVGRGFSSYTAPGYYGNLTDYVPLSDLISNPEESFTKVFSHMFENFRFMAPSLVAILLVLLFELWRVKNGHGNGHGKGGTKAVGAGLLFVVVHTLATTQILVESLTRLMLPAYLVSVACVGFGAIHLIESLSRSRIVFAASGLMLAVVLTAASVDMARFRMVYNSSIKAVLEDIKNTDGDIAFVSRTDLEVGKSKIFGFTQYPIILDWTLVQPVYDKYIVLTGGAGDGIGVMVNGSVVNFGPDDGMPFVVNECTYVPLRAMAEAYGATVEYNDDAQEAVIEKDGVTVRVPIGEKFIYCNGKKVKNDAPALTNNSCVYIPLRKVMESLGADVGWDEATSTVTVDDRGLMFMRDVENDYKRLVTCRIQGKGLRSSASPTPPFPVWQRFCVKSQKFNLSPELEIWGRQDTVLGGISNEKGKVCFRRCVNGRISWVCTKI